MCSIPGDVSGFVVLWLAAVAVYRDDALLHSLLTWRV
jgi:hypothetical protein